MVRIREAERLIVRDYHLDEMKTPMHMSWGEEAIVCGISEALGSDALVSTTYRSHALYLHRTRNTFEFFCEMMGRTGGCSDGRSGSMHLGDINAGMLMSSAIVGGNISVAVGAAFGLQYLKRNTRAACFFGDGATDAGTFWESLNIAALFRAPVIFVCADNDLAVHSTETDRKGFSMRQIGRAVASLGIPCLYLDCYDVFEIFSKVRRFITQHPVGPIFLHAKWFRYLEHVGISTDFNAGYRDQPSEAFLKSVDPIVVSRAALIRSGVTECEITSIEQSLRIDCEEDLNRARSMPLASVSTVSLGVR